MSEDARRDLEELKSSYRTVKKEKSLPSRKMLLHASRNLSPASAHPIFAGETPVQSSFFLRCAVGVAPQLWSSTSQEQQGRPQGKESRSCVAFNWKAIFKVLLGTRRDGWTPPAPADWRPGYIPGRRRESASHDMEAGTTWPEVTHSLSRFDKRIWVSQVGGNGSSRGGASGSEKSSGIAEIQTGDHNDPGK